MGIMFFRTVFKSLVNSISFKAKASTVISESDLRHEVYYITNCSNLQEVYKGLA